MKLKDKESYKVKDNFILMSNKNTRVVVALSGGVDSSVAAYLLVKQGYDVIGIFMKNWEEDDNDEFCSAEQDIADAQSVCDSIGIPFKKINFLTLIYTIF